MESNSENSNAESDAFREEEQDSTESEGVEDSESDDGEEEEDSDSDDGEEEEDTESEGSEEEDLEEEEEDSVDDSFFNTVLEDVRNGNLRIHSKEVFDTILDNDEFPEEISAGSYLDSLTKSAVTSFYTGAMRTTG